MIEILAQIRAPHFTAGIVLWDDQVVEAAPIVGYMKKGRWTRDVVRDYCKRKGWEISVIHEVRAPDSSEKSRQHKARQGDPPDQPGAGLVGDDRQQENPD